MAKRRIPSKRRTATARPRRRAMTGVKRRPVRRSTSGKAPSPLMAIALGIGGGLAAGYIASSAPVVKLIPSARNRALALAAVGAGASIYAVKAKIPMLLPVSVGVGIAAGVGAVQLLLAENKSASNTSVRKQNGVLARLTAAEVAEIRRKVSDTSYRLNGIRAGVITGRGNNMAAGVIVGGGDLPGMDRFS